MAATVTPRRVVTLAVLLVLASMVALGLVWIDRMGREVAEVQIFERPRSFCEEFHSEAFSFQAAGVAATSGQLRSTVAEVEAGFLKQISTLVDTPPEVQRDLVQLAEELRDGASTGDFDPARTTASGIDEAAGEHCG